MRTLEMRNSLNGVESHAELIRVITNHIGDAVIACDIKGKLIYYNLAAAKLIGPEVEGGVPQDWATDYGAFLPDKVTPFPQELQPLLRGLTGEETHDVEQYLVNKTNPCGIFISISGRPILDEQSRILGCVIVIRDITLRKQAEEGIDRLNDVLMEKNLELAAVNRELESFSYAVSHDLRTPLRGIIGFSDILLRKFNKSLDAEGIDYLNRIKDAGNQLGQLIDGLLDLSRLSRGELKRGLINLSDIAQAVALTLKSQEPGRPVTFKIMPSIFAKADQRLMHSVLLNLMGNAWKFSAKASEPVIEFGVSIRDDKTQVYFVKDNGAGFNEKYSAKLFKIFQRLHSNREFDGNGIGLATVDRIIKRHGGTVWAEGKKNEGATFYFTLN